MLRYKRLLILSLIGALVLPVLTTEASSIRDLENQQNTIRQEITGYENEMVSVLAQISVLEGEISQTEAEIADTEANLADAYIAKEQKYIQMCQRIKYNYENKEENVFSVMLSAKSLSDFINQIEYANSIAEYDNQMLDTYQAICVDIENIKTALEETKAGLAIKRQQLGEKKASLDSMIADARSRQADVDTKLAAARAEAERRAREEAARRAAALAAANAASANAGTSGNLNPSPKTNISGADVIAYANQFVGNRYVWGGNSLTNGVDCSGFVVQIYKHFGIDLSGSRHTSLLEKVGSPVSYNNMQPGDIVCYSGHVGLYTGNGTIVEAQSSRAGITNNRSVNNKAIITIRRVI